MSGWVGGDEAGEERSQVSPIDRGQAGEKLPGDMIGDVASRGEDRLAVVGERDGSGAAVAGDGTPFDQPESLEVVDCAKHGRLVATELHVELRLGGRAEAGEGDEDAEVLALDAQRLERLAERLGGALVSEPQEQTYVRAGRQLVRHRTRIVFREKGSSEKLSLENIL
jgi:hypothetical protein